jgi:BolA protein
MRRKLIAAFAPETLDIVDESARHEGHAGHKPGGQTHFRVRIVADSFGGLTRLERQRRVYAALAQELSNGVHALALNALTPAEASRL